MCLSEVLLELVPRFVSSGILFQIFNSSWWDFDAIMFFMEIIITCLLVNGLFPSLEKVTESSICLVNVSKGWLGSYGCFIFVSLVAISVVDTVP